MAEQEIADQLRQLQFLRDLSEDSIEALSDVSRQVTIESGTTIFRQGDSASTLYLIVDGDVSLEICAPGVGCKKILTVGPGELLGWSPVLSQAKLTATSRAVSTVRAIEINGADVLAICEQNPHFGYEFMKRAALALAKRLNATRLQLLDVFGTEANASKL